jgi:hypothetical protein
MRRLLTGFVIAAVAAVVPAMALAGNQEIAEQIASTLRKSGQMSSYKIGVKYQDGTAWLQGRVSSPEQMKTALRLTFQVSAVDRIVNEMKVVSSETAAPAENLQAQYQEGEQTPAENQAASSESNPLRGRNTPAESLRPTKTGLLNRIGAFVARKPASNPQPAQQQDDPAYADQLPSEETTSAVRPVAAEELQDSPRPLAMPNRVTPVSRVTREPATVAMMQPMVRGPMAPNGNPMPMYTAAANPAGVAPARYDQPCMPNYAWPSYAAYPNYAAVTYPKQYSPTVWPYIGPFYPYPQVPLGWRKVTLEWDSGWWFLDFKDQPASCWHR